LLRRLDQAVVLLDRADDGAAGGFPVEMVEPQVVAEEARDARLEAV
jgi:hypothetical protein